jgi:hypothetical protein
MALTRAETKRNKNFQNSGRDPSKNQQNGALFGKRPASPFIFFLFRKKLGVACDLPSLK